MKRFYVFSLLSVGLAVSANAQLNSSSPWSAGNKQTLGLKPPPPPDSPSPIDVPLDGGLCVLLAAGALYGKRVYNRKNAAAK
jgi:hypothetical protein